MQDRPKISAAMPKRRYRIGQYSATLLADIDSADARAYRYILAFVPEGQREPRLYVCSESAMATDQPQRCHLRVISETLSDVVDSDPRWADAEQFAEQALRLGAQALGLSQLEVVAL